MKRSMGRRAFRRSVADAGLGSFPPILGYKIERSRGHLFIADRFFASTKIHHGCGGRLTGPKLAKHLACETCGAVVDRDVNAAKNLRDWPETNANPGSVGASAPLDPGPPACATDGGSDGRSTDHRTRRRTTNWQLSVRRAPKLAKASWGTPQGVHLGEITHAHSDAAAAQVADPQGPRQRLPWHRDRQSQPTRGGAA
jgi:hypothetical protein